MMNTMTTSMSLLLVALVCASAKDDSFLKGTELVSTFLIHRHGDRTPIKSYVHVTTDPEKVRKLSNPYGYEELTEQGKRRGYDLGKFLRRRYKKLLGQTFNSSEVLIRSTDINRSKMTSLTLLAAVYQPGHNSWGQKIKWTPVPYTTVPVKYDFNLAIYNCPKYADAMHTLLKSKPASMQKYSKVLNLVSEKSGFNITQVPPMIYVTHDVYVSQIELGVPLSPEIEEVFPEIQEAANDAMYVVFDNKDYIALQAGVLLQEFYNSAAKIQAGEHTEKARLYSGHDFNVFSLIAVTQVKYSLGVPKYGSMYALELRKVVKTGEYVVVPVYLPSPEDDVVYLQVKGCNTLCSYEDFVNITSPYALDEDTWRTKCGFTQDMVIDTSI